MYKYGCSLMLSQRNLKYYSLIINQLSKIANCDTMKYIFIFYYINVRGYMNRFIELFKKYIVEIIISITSTLILSFFTFIWDSTDKSFEISLREILIFLCFVFVFFWLLLLLISILSHFKEMKRNRNVYCKLSKYLKNNEAVKSIQFYSIPNLSKPTDYNDDYIKVQVNRIGGLSEEDFETNCIVNDSYYISSSFYSRYYYGVFKSIREVEHSIRLNSKISDANLIYLLDQIDNCCFGIINEYLNIDTIEEIKPEHYFYYRTLYVLANKGAIYATLLQQRYNRIKFINDGCSCKMDRVLIGKSLELEEALKRGKRSQYFGAFMTGELFVFSHETNTIKSERSYFSSLFCFPGIKHSCLMVVTYDNECLSAVSEGEAIAKCECIRNEINHIVTGRKEIEEVYEI